MRFWGCLHHTVCTSLKRINWNINYCLTVGSKRSKLIGLNACSFWESNLHDNTLISSSYLSNRATASSIVEGLHCENGSLAVASSTNPNTAVAEESMFFWNEAIFLCDQNEWLLYTTACWCVVMFSLNSFKDQSLRWLMILSFISLWPFLHFI